MFIISCSTESIQIQGLIFHKLEKAVFVVFIWAKYILLQNQEKES